MNNPKYRAGPFGPAKNVCVLIVYFPSVGGGRIGKPSQICFSRSAKKC